MLPSILHLKRIYEKRGGKVPSVSKTTATKSRPKLPQIFIYQDSKIVHRYYGKDFPSFGIFSGDLLVIQPNNRLSSVP